jgi:hypothetical protein
MPVQIYSKTKGLKPDLLRVSSDVRVSVAGKMTKILPCEFNENIYLTLLEDLIECLLNQIHRNRAR